MFLALSGYHFSGNDEDELIVSIEHCSLNYIPIVFVLLCFSGATLNGVFDPQIVDGSYTTIAKRPFQVGQRR